MMTKRRTLVLVLAIMFVGAIAEAAFWPERGNQQLALAQTVLCAIFIYWWYHLDKAQRGFRAGILQNMGVAVLSVIGLPVYFVRSRGWRQGAIAILWSLGFMAIVFAVVIAGFLIGRQVGF